MLELKDGPMFGRVMRDEELCREVLEVILGFEIGRIEYLNTEQTFDPATYARGVRLDVFAKESGKVYDIEMQTVPEGNIAKRMRYYQSMIDTSILDKGVSYNKLDESYIIFICDFDVFGKGLPAYHLERTCEEDPTVTVNNGSHWLALNTCAWNKETNSALAKMLNYIHSGKVSDRLSTRLDEAVSHINSDAEWRRHAMGFMTWEMSHQAAIDYAMDKGIEQGEAIQSARDNELVKRMLDAGRIDDLKRSTEDPQFREQLFEEFGL